MSLSPARVRRSSNRQNSASAQSPTRRAPQSPVRSRGRDRDGSPHADSSSRSSRRSSDESQSPARPSSSRPHTPIRTRSRARADAASRADSHGDGHLVSFAPFSWFSSSPAKGAAAAASDNDASANADMSVLFERSSTPPVRGNFLNGMLLGLAMLSIVIVWAHSLSWMGTELPRLAGTSGSWMTRSWRFIRAMFSFAILKEACAGPGGKFFVYSLIAASIMTNVYVLSNVIRTAWSRCQAQRGRKSMGECIMGQVPFVLLSYFAYNTVVSFLGLSAGFSLYLLARRTLMPASATANKSIGGHLAAGLFYLAATAVSLAMFASRARDIWATGIKASLWDEADKSHLVAACFWDFRLTACVLALAVLQSAARHGYLPAKLRTRAEVWLAIALSFPIAATGLTLLPSAYYCASELGQAAAMGRRSRAAAAGKKVH